MNLHHKTIPIFVSGDNVIAKNDPYKNVREVVSTQGNLAFCTYTDPYGIKHKREYLFEQLDFAPIQNELFGDL